MTESLILDERAVGDFEARLDRFLSALTFGEPLRGNRYVESIDGNYYYEEHTDNEFDAFDLLRQVPALCATVKYLRDSNKQLSHDAEVETRRGDNWERRAKQMGRDIEALEQEREGLRGQAVELHNRIGERNNRVVELHSQLEQLRERLAQVEQERDYWRTQATEASKAAEKWYGERY